MQVKGPSLFKAPGVAVLSSQAGPAMAACDICEKEGMKIVHFQGKTQRRINKVPERAAPALSALWEFRRMRDLNYF